MGGRGGKGPAPQNNPNAPTTPSVLTPGAPGTPGGSPGGGGGGGGGGGKNPGTTSPGGVTNPQGGGNGPGGGSSTPTSTPAPPPQKWYDNVPLTGKKDLVHDDEELRRDTYKVNPRNNEPITPGNDYKNNCTRVSAAWILRTFFGWDVTAGAAPYMQNGQPGQPGGMDWFDADILNKWFDPKTGRQRAETKVPATISDPTAPNGERYMTQEEWYNKTKEMILADHPEGSGGFMVIRKHIFNWRITNGEVRFIEAQSQPFDAVFSRNDPTVALISGQETYKSWDKDALQTVGSRWWEISVNPTDGQNWFIRVDDLEPKKTLFDNKWVQVVTKGERNAPFLEDMVLQSYALYPSDADLRAAFRKGWDQVRSGRRPRSPNGWNGTPSEAAYRAGIKYAQEPD